MLFLQTANIYLVRPRRIPNIPFFYLCFRAYSHFRAWYGSKLLDFLTTKNLVRITASTQLDQIYARGLLAADETAATAEKESPPPTKEQIEQVVQTIESQTQNGTEEIMISRSWNGRPLDEGFQLPGMEVEIERAVEQVQKSIHSQKESDERKAEGLSKDSAQQKNKGPIDQTTQK